MTKTKLYVIGGVVVLIGAVVVWHLMLARTAHRSRRSVASVEVTKVTQKAAPLFVKMQGVVEASQAVAIQPQVSGIVNKIGFTPGDNVNAGQLLFQLDATTYQAALAKDRAALAKDLAQLNATKIDVKRYQALIKQGFVSKQQYDQVQASLGMQLGMVKSDQALIAQDTAKLNYTDIKAPIAGKTGNVLVKVGDLVGTSNAQALVTIKQLSPIYVSFYLPQNYLPWLRQYQSTQPLTVEVHAEGQKQLLGVGKLTFIDNSVDQSTGTILLKAIFPNNNGELWPGQAVNVKLIFKVESNVLAIPSRAVQSGQQGEFVYLLQNNRIHVTPITVLRQVGKWTYISKGLQLNDVVATVFPPDLQDKSLVQIVPSSAGQN